MGRLAWSRLFVGAFLQFEKYLRKYLRRQPPHLLPFPPPPPPPPPVKIAARAGRSGRCRRHQPSATRPPPVARRQPPAARRPSPVARRQPPPGRCPPRPADENTTERRPVLLRQRPPLRPGNCLPSHETLSPGESSQFQGIFFCLFCFCFENTRALLQKNLLRIPENFQESPRILEDQ